VLQDVKCWLVKKIKSFVVMVQSSPTAARKWLVLDRSQRKDRKLNYAPLGSKWLKTS